MSVGAVGDAICKKASMSSGLEKYILVCVVGLMWFFASFAWTEIYKQKSLTEMLVMSNMIHGAIIISAGMFIFHEPITPKTATALILLFVSMWLMR